MNERSAKYRSALTAVLLAVVVVPMVRAAERYRMELYKRFFEESGEGMGEKGEPVPQTWVVGDVEHCVEELKGFIEAFGITDIVTMAVPPGLRAEQMAPSLERLFKEVVPRLKAEVKAEVAG